MRQSRSNPKPRSHTAVKLSAAAGLPAAAAAAVLLVLTAVSMGGDHWFSRPLTRVQPGTGGLRTIEQPKGADKDIMTAVTAVSPVDLTISLYADPTGDNDPTTQDNRTPYERVIQNFADGVYEASNGKHQLRTVRVYRNSRFADKADILWEQSGWPRANPSGFGTAGERIYMYSEFGSWRFLADERSHRAGGYILAHEFGHYAYGLYDEYKGTNSVDDTCPWSPHTNDVAVEPSIMHFERKAVDGDYRWLNFSIAYEDPRADFTNTKKTAQHRMREASGWETLVRSPDQDPKTGSQNTRPKRIEWTDLAGAAPVSPAHWKQDLPSTAARDLLTIIWMESEVTYEIVIDHSGSMCGSNKMDDAKTAASLLVDVAEPGSSIGVIKFDDNVTVVQAIVEIQTQADKDAIKTKIQSIACDGSTAIGEAANKALTELQGYGSGTENKVVFLLSDGLSNTGRDPLSVIPAYQTAQIPMFTFGYGSDADEDVLREMAESTGGKYYFLPTTLAEITQAFADANQQVAGSVGLDSGLPTVAPGGTLQRVFTVDPTLTAMNVVVSFAGGSENASVKLFNPSGTEISPSSTISAGGSTQVRYGIDHPMPGDWRLLIVSQTGSSLDVGYHMDALASDALTFSLSLANLTSTVVQYPDPILLLAVLQKDRPLAGAVVTAQLEDPDGNVTNIDLCDDGQSPDVLADDGHYSGILMYAKSGVYSIRVLMDNSAGTARLTSAGLQTIAEDGTDDPTPDEPVSEPFQRSATLQLTVQGVVTDDHGNTPSVATMIPVDNSDTPGRIEKAGDVDAFRTVVPAGAAPLVVRVTDFSPGMEPVLSLLDAGGQELKRATLPNDAAQDGYLMAAIQTSGGATIYALVLHANADGTGNYRISAGSAIGSDRPPDSDGDGVPDTSDVCPGEDDTLDADADDVPDCLDGCPGDPAKTLPGTCDCGTPDTDTDGDGTPDCIDGCPDDPAKIAPGACRCGVANTDTDGDGVANCVDNCPDAPNADQRDSNSDGVGDACTEPPAGSACGCSAGLPLTVPLMLLGIGWMKRRRR